MLVTHIVIIFELGLHQWSSRLILTIFFIYNDFSPVKTVGFFQD